MPGYKIRVLPNSELKLLGYIRELLRQRAHLLPRNCSGSNLNSFLFSGLLVPRRFCLEPKAKSLQRKAKFLPCSQGATQKGSHLKDAALTLRRMGSVLAGTVERASRVSAAFASVALQGKTTRE